jgi:hypothetical protein
MKLPIHEMSWMIPLYDRDGSAPRTTQIEEGVASEVSIFSMLYHYCPLKS